MIEKLPFGISSNVTGNKTLAATDQGNIQNVVSDATITLPATAAGLVFVIQNGGDNPTGTPAGAVSDGSVGITISPNAADKIVGLGAAGTDDKDIVNTKATSKVGDYIILVGQTDGWNVLMAKGTWTREA